MTKQTSFALCPTWVYENPALSAGAVRLYLVLSQRVLTPIRHSDLARIASCSSRSAAKYLGELEREGWIDWLYADDGRSRRYLLRDPTITA